MVAPNLLAFFLLSFLLLAQCLLLCSAAFFPFPIRRMRIRSDGGGITHGCQTGNCCDTRRQCGKWAAEGECQRNPWMAKNCQISCGTCRRHNISAIPPPRLLPVVAIPPAIQQPADAPIPAAHVPHIPPPPPPKLIRPPPPPSPPPPPPLPLPPPPPPSISPAAVDSIPAFTGAISCETIAQQRLDNAIELLTKSGHLNPIEDVSGRQTLALGDITTAAGSGCVPELTSADCSHSLCYHLAYRSLDGVCNNLRTPLLGASFRHYFRHLPAEYANGFSEPISSRRPSAREASRLLLASARADSHDQLNSLLMQFGQFISHDIARTTLQPSANCGTCQPIPGKCIPITISADDNNDGFRSKGCLKVARSAPVCGTGNGPGQPREQLDENTAFVDGSQIYGSSSRDLQKFRDGRTGFLKMSTFNNMLVLPFDEAKCASANSCPVTFTAGDIRVNLFLGLSAMHIVFAREHNRIARGLQRINPGWSGDRLFQEARKIVGAQIQAILYREFLPTILGAQTFHRLIGTFTAYDPGVDPSIANEFTTSAYRFGHGMILEQYPRLSENGQSILAGHFQFGDGVFKSQKILFEGGIDPILRGLWNTPIKKPNQMTPSITERMFGSTDLGALNIMRGRDNGIPGFNKWRRFCGLQTAATFSQITQNRMVQTNLEAIYGSTDDLDLYVGGMLEENVPGGLVGPTFACIIGDQFKRSRDGDRFYFENPGIFTQAQMNEIRKMSLSRILCDNGDRIREVPRQAFMLPFASGGGGNAMDCSQIPQIDLSKWRE